MVYPQSLKQGRKMFKQWFALFAYKIWEAEIMKVAKTETKKGNIKSPGFIENVKRYKSVYLLILPAVLFMFVFNYLPFGGIVIAFKDFDIIKGISGSPWVGFDNFIDVFTQKELLGAIYNTLIYGLVLVFGAFPFPIILALMFNELRNMKFKKTVQTITYMPYFLSWISVVGLFYTLFGTEGVFNTIMSKIVGEGFEAKNILLDEKYFLPIIFISHLWKTIGWNSILFLAAITGIDPSLYEAASIDGCGKLKQTWHITLPGIRQTIVVVLVMSMSSLVSSNFDQIYGFQNVYTQPYTETINTVIYRRGIQDGRYSLATAFGLSQGLVSITLILISNALSKKIANASIW